MNNGKKISRIANLGWFFGLFYFQSIMTTVFVLKRIKLLFQTHTVMLLLSAASIMLALGMIIAIRVMRKTQDDRVHNVVSLFTIIAYVMAFVGMHIRQPTISFILCVSLCMALVGYNIGLVNSALASSLRLDKYAGRVIGLSAFFCCGLLTLSALFHTERLFFAGSCLLLIYFYCRPPMQHLQIRHRVLRNDLKVISTKRTVINYLSIIAILGLRCGAGICLIVPIYNINSLISDFCTFAIFWGLGALFCGFLRDWMNKYLPMLAFYAICFTLVIDTVFGGVRSNHLGIALGEVMAGCTFLYYTCIGTDFPVEEKPPNMIHKAVFTFVLSIGLSIVMLSTLLPLADGRTMILTISSLSIVFILGQLFYDNIYQSHETPEVSFEIRADLFKSQYGLTVREGEVLSLVLTSENSLKGIAGELYISISTLEKHMTSIYEKTHTKNRSELTHKFFSDARSASNVLPSNIKQ